MNQEQDELLPKAGVFAAPNASEVHGQVRSKRQNPSGEGCILEIAVSQSKAVTGLANLAKPHEGDTIPVYVHPEIQDTVEKDDNVEMRVTYMGDAANGAFVVEGNNLRRTSNSLKSNSD